MKNIFEIFITDFKRIKTNVVAIVIIIGLVVLPSLYAWFNILSNWDPYGEESTSRIKVAIASDDEGAQLEGVYFNMGDQVISALEANTTIGWVFTDTTQDAIDGVYSGDYYAALVMPETFTADLISFLSDDMTHPEITYYENEKKNAIAPKITSKATTAVQQQVNATFVSTLAETMTGAVSTALDTEELKTLGITSSDSLVDVVILRLENILVQIESYETLVDSLIVVIDSVTATGEVADDIDAGGTVSSAQSSLNSISNSLNTGISSYMSITDSLLASIASLQGALSSISSVSAELSSSMDEMNENLTNMQTTLVETKDLITDMKLNVQDSVDELNALKEDDSYQMLMQLMTTDPTEVGSFMSEPVTIETVRVYPVENYGSAMAPFYTVLAIWVGSLIMSAILHTKVHPIEGVTLTANNTYVGRFITFFLVGQLQALLTVLGDLFFVEIACEEPLKLWLAGATASFVFTLLIYSLTYALGNVGQALAVVIMVIQVAGAGGTFPKEVLPEVFQNIYNLLPFPYAMDAMREAVGGLYENYYWECLGHLLIFVPVSVIIGLGGAKVFAGLNKLIEKNKEDSGVMV